MREQALARARDLDAALARGNNLGALHGVPIHVKESFAVEGQPCTWGIPELKNAKAPANSDVVDQLLGAGAVLLGATNVPVNLADWQSYNPIYGTTNNPWDVKRTPGGSSGGSAAALAAGLGYLSMGSDIGGSLRMPAHFTGIFAHKPTLDLVSLTGHAPGGVRATHGFSTLLAVAGPMARDAADLLAVLDIVGGPQAWDRKAWSWKLPAPRAKALEGFPSRLPLRRSVRAGQRRPAAGLRRRAQVAREGRRATGARLALALRVVEDDGNLRVHAAGVLRVADAGAGARRAA